MLKILGSTSILVVEDERIVARDLKFTLEGLGYTVPGVVDTGELAIQKVADTRPDLVLMDIHLKGSIDGIEAARVISTRYETPVVYLTAHFDEESIARAKQTYPLGYVIKPYNRRELNITIRVALYKHEMDRRIRHEAQWLSTLLNSIGDGVIATDVDGYITLLNPVAEKLTAWSSSEAIGLSENKIFKVINEHSRKYVESPIKKALETRSKQTLPDFTLLISKNGIETPIEDSAAPIFSSKNLEEPEDGNNFIIGSVMVFRDTSYKREIAKKLTRQAFYDSLTNLPNRDWFRERLTDALERVKRQPSCYFAVLLLDLDHFKSVNDGLGHDVGDQLLAAVGERLTCACRSIDTVARLGGDEFIVLLENINSEAEVHGIVHRIQSEINAPYNIIGQEIFATASIGVVLYFSNHDIRETIDNVIRNADIAMYYAKASGRGCYQIYDQEMREKIILKSQVESDLHRVIERNELQVYYQPIFSLDSGQINGFEALVRWQHPIRGLVAPGDFLPIANGIGLDLQIDRWVFSTATQQILEWRVKYPNLHNLMLNINLSGNHFTQSKPLKWIIKSLYESKFPPQQLNLEITEDILIKNTELAISVLMEVKKLGVFISIDDFGTGYSSLKYLQRFPIDSIKIDRAFIEGLGEQDQDSLEIVRAIISLGQVLKKKVVAEGIEGTKQLEILKTLKCEYGQGYYFSRPLPNTEAEILLQSYS